MTPQTDILWVRAKEDKKADSTDADDGYPYDEEDNEYEEFDCHRGPDGSCDLAGTEECDWECPYNRR